MSLLASCERRQLIKVEPPTDPQLVSSQGLTWQGGNVIVLQIESGSVLVLDGTIYQSDSMLQRELKRRRQESASPPSVILRADRHVPYGDVLKIVHLVSQSGYANISLSVQRDGAGKEEWLQTFSYR